MIKIGHFRSKLDVLFHVLISSFFKRNYRDFRGLFFEHLKLNFRPSIFFNFQTIQKIYEIEKLDQIQSIDVIRHHIACVKLHIKLRYCTRFVELDVLLAVLLAVLQLLAICCILNANKAVNYEHGWNSNFTLFWKTLMFKISQFFILLVLNVESPILDRYKEFACSRINSC